MMKRKEREGKDDRQQKRIRKQVQDSWDQVCRTWNKTTKTFCVRGPFGVGKTELLRNFCEARRNVAASFFFSKGSTSVRDAILSISNQLASSIIGFRPVETVAETQGVDVKLLFQRLICLPLRNASHQGGTAFVVVDAVEEVQERDDMFEIVTKMWRKEVPEWLGLLFSCRGDLFSQGADIVHKMSYSFDKVNGFARESLGRCTTSTEREVEEVAALVTTASNGCFLHAKLLLEALGSDWNLFDICEFMAGRDVDRICDKMYKENLERFLMHSLQGDVDVFRKLLSILAVCREPLDLELVEKVLGSKWTEGVMKQATELLVADGLCVAFPHKNMASFLLSVERAGAELHVPSELGHRLLSEILLGDRTLKHSAYALRHLVSHLCALEDWASVRRCMLDFGWICSLVLCCEGAAQQVICDLDGMYNYTSHADTCVTDITRAMELCLGTVEMTRDTFAFQLLGRIYDQGNPILSQIIESTRLPLRPLQPCLESARSRVRKRVRFEQSVTCVAISDAFWLFGTQEGTLCASLRNRCAPKPTWVLCGHQDMIESAAAEQHIAVSGSGDQSMRVWDLRVGACLRVFEHPAGVNAVALQGNIVVSGSRNGALRVWNWRTGNWRHVLLGHACAVRAVAIDRGKLVSGAFDHTLKLWDLQTGKCLHTLEGASSHCSVAIHDTILVSGSNTTSCTVWNVPETGVPTLCYNLGESSAHASAVAVNDRTIAVGLNDGTINVWTQSTRKLVATCEGHQGAVTSIDVCGTTMVSGSVDETVRLWDISSNQFHSDKVPGLEVTTVAVDGSLVLAGYKDGSMRIFISSSGKCLHECASPPEKKEAKGRMRRVSKKVLAVAFANDHCGVGVFQDGIVRTWDTRTGMLRNNFSLLQAATGFDLIKSWLHRIASVFVSSGVHPGHNEDVSCATIDGSLLLSGSRDRTARLWDVHSGKCLQAFTGHRGAVSSVALLECSTAVTGEGVSEGLVRVWDCLSGSLVRVLDMRCFGVCAVTLSNRLVAAASFDGSIVCWEYETGRRLCDVRFHEQQVCSLAVVHQHIISASVDQTLRIFDAYSATSCQVATFDEPLLSMALSYTSSQHVLVVVGLRQLHPTLLAYFIH